MKIFILCTCLSCAHYAYGISISADTSKMRWIVLGEENCRLEGNKVPVSGKDYTTVMATSSISHCRQRCENWELGSCVGIEYNKAYKRCSIYTSLPVSVSTAYTYECLIRGSDNIYTNFGYGACRGSDPSDSGSGGGGGEPWYNTDNTYSYKCERDCPTATDCAVCQTPPWSLPKAEELCNRVCDPEYQYQPGIPVPDIVKQAMQCEDPQGGCVAIEWSGVTNHVELWKKKPEHTAGKLSTVCEVKKPTVTETTRDRPVTRFLLELLEKAMKQIPAQPASLTTLNSAVQLRE